MRKRCVRRHYALINPIQHAIAGAAVTDDRLLAHLKTVELSAIESMRTGKASREDWKAMADMTNLAESMGKDGIGPEVLPYAKAAEEALIRAHGRHAEGKGLGMDAEGLQALRELAEWHHLQRTSISRAEYERAIKRCADRIRSMKGSAVVVTL